MVEIGKPLGVAPINPTDGSSLEKNPSDDEDYLNRSMEAGSDHRTLLKLANEAGYAPDHFYQMKKEADKSRAEQRKDDERREALGKKSFFAETLARKVEENK